MSNETTITPQPQESPHWGLVATLLWGLGIAFSFVVVQSIAIFAYLTRGKTGLSEQQLQELADAAQNDGNILALATLATAGSCVPLIFGVAKLKPESNVAEYLAVNAVSPKTVGLWLAVVALFIAASDGLTVLLGRPLVPEVMTTTYASANPVWLLWLAIVAAAPLFEELFFRGFLFKGFQGALGPAATIVITSLLWAVIHLQYDVYNVGLIFISGLLLGAARIRTNSVLTPLAMHAFMNVIATGEVALLARSAAS